MSYSIEPSEEGKYIILKHWGELTSVLAMERNLEAHALGAELGISRYLVDGTESRNVDTVTKTYKFAYEDMKIPPGINQNARIAMLVSPDDHSHDFVETVARNSGLNMNLFRDMDAAVQHLLSR